MDAQVLREQILREVQLTFTLSGGPGGQNVNKVHTRVTGRLDLDRLECLAPEQRERVRRRLPGRINAGGERYLSVQRHRTQRANREELIESLEGMILASLKRTPPRRKTKPTKASRERRLTAKKKRSDRKRERRFPLD